MVTRLVVPALVVLATAGPHAQVSRPKAEVTPLVEGTAQAGSDVRAALEVTLPEGLHTQSNRPRDATLIPTTLTVDPPAGVTVDEVVWPAPIDLAQAGSDKPLAVFERAFLIGVRFSLSASTGAADLTVPARLRYQACDANLCFPPATATVQWTVHVVPAGGPLHRITHARARSQASSSARGRNPLHRGRPRAGTVGVCDRRSPPATMCRSLTTSRSQARPGDTRTRRIFSSSSAARKPASRPAACSKGAARSRSCSSCSWGASHSTSRRACCR